MIKLYIMSKALAEDIQKFSKDALVISIGSPGIEPARIEGEHIFKFQFHDVQEDLGLVETNNFSGIVNKMTKEIAESIVKIVMNHRDKKVLVIHCEVGVSRSPGVAIGLASYINTIPDRKKLIELFPCYNKHVCKLVEDAMEVKMKELTTGLHIQKLLMEGR